MTEMAIWAPAIARGVTLPALLVPDGRLRSRRWRVIAATAVAGLALHTVQPASASLWLRPAQRR